MEVDALDFVSDTLLNDSGQVIGKMTAESFDAAQYEVRGKCQFIVTAMSPALPDKVHNVMSKACDEDNRDAMLYEALCHVAHSVAVNFVRSQPPAPSRIILNGCN